MQRDYRIERMNESDLSEIDRRSFYDDKVAGFWFDRLITVDASLGYRDKRLTGHWLLEQKKDENNDGASS